MDCGPHVCRKNGADATGKEGDALLLHAALLVKANLAPLSRKHQRLAGCTCLEKLQLIRSVDGADIPLISLTSTKVNSIRFHSLQFSSVLAGIVQRFQSIVACISAADIHLIPPSPKSAPVPRQYE